MAIESPEYKDPVAEVSAEAPQNNAVVGMGPEQIEDLKNRLAIERQKALLNGQMTRGEFDPKNIDFKNPAQVAAAEELIFEATGQKIKYSPEAGAGLTETLTTEDKQRGVAAREAARDEVREQESAVRVARADADKEGRTTILGKEVFVEGAIAPAVPAEKFNADVEKQRLLDAELAENPLVALRRERSIALNLEGQPEGAEWRVLDTKGDEITVFRVDRFDANGAPIQDPMNWKVVQRVIRAGDVQSKYKGRLLS
jgi:hypothetical protein